jgi:hypothetical protein
MIPGKRKNNNSLLYETSVSIVTCFNCYVPKLLGNSATNEKQLHATQIWVGIG